MQCTRFWIDFIFFLQIHLCARITVNKLLNNNRVDYYNNKLTIDESDTKILFKVARKLIGDDGNPSLPS